MAGSARMDRPQATPKQRASDVRVALGGGAQETNAQAELERLSRAAGGGGAVSSVFGRAGAVVAVSGDYEASEVTFSPTGSISSTTVQAAIAEVSAAADAAIPKSLIDAKGDLIVGSAADTAARLPVGGTAGHVLAVKPAATYGIDWIPVPVADATTQGIVELATTAETETGTDATRAVTPEGAAATFVRRSLVDAKGDLVAATGSDAPARLPVGSNGQFLVADASTSTGLAWMSVAFAAALVGVDILRGLDVVMGEQPQTALAITGSLSTVT